MKDNQDLLNIVQTVLSTMDHRQSYAPGMFEPLKPLFRELGYESAAVYLADDYPDRMQLVCGYGGEKWFPAHVVLNQRTSLASELKTAIGQVPGLMVEGLFSHERELGVLAVTCRNTRTQKSREAFKIIAHTVSIMAYLERVRTNGRREREERDVFFAQSLTNRLLVREAPKLRELRLGSEFIRSLDAGGDFFDFIPEPDGNLLGWIGCCSGNGLRTVLEVASIMREIYHSCHAMGAPADAIRTVNRMLVKEKHRAHQASLAIFRVDIHNHKLHIAKAGRLGILLCGPGSAVNNISAPGTMFLGMVDKPDLRNEEYDFEPGQALFCVTEGFYSSRNAMGASPQVHWFIQSVAETMERRRRVPLAKAIFDSVNGVNDQSVRPDDSMLAVSVEFTGRRDSVRIRNSERIYR